MENEYRNHMKSVIRYNMSQRTNLPYKYVMELCGLGRKRLMLNTQYAPRIDNLLVLCRYFNCTPNDLLEGLY